MGKINTGSKGFQKDHVLPRIPRAFGGTKSSVFMKGARTGDSSVNNSALAKLGLKGQNSPTDNPQDGKTKY